MATTTTTIKMYVRYNNFTGAEIANSSEFEAAVEEEVESLLRELDTIYDVLGEFEHSFADLLTAEGEERESLVAELLALFRKKPENLCWKMNGLRLMLRFRSMN